MKEKDNTIITTEKDIMVMKLLHYFITIKNYSPIVLQGASDEIWLENLDEEYGIVRIVSDYIHNKEQYEFDLFKTKRIVNKIKKKMFYFKVNTLSIFLDLGSSVELSEHKSIDSIFLKEEEDIKKNELFKEKFPEITKELDYKEKGYELLSKITGDISEHNLQDAKKQDEIFRKKYPIITYLLMAICFAFYFLPILFETYGVIIENFSVHGPSIRSGEIYRIVSGMFLHGNLFHLLLNMYALFVVGTQLESFLGKVKFLTIYLFSGIVATLMSMIFLGDNFSIGASGAIFGLLGAFAYFGYHYRVYFGNVMKNQLLPLILINIIFGFTFSNIDNAAHIGGLIGGIFITKALGLKYKTSKSSRINGIIISLIYLLFLIYMSFVMTN